jgi:hypothetical protein
MTTFLYMEDDQIRHTLHDYRNTTKFASPIRIVLNAIYVFVYCFVLGTRYSLYCSDKFDTHGSLHRR